MHEDMDHEHHEHHESFDPLRHGRRHGDHSLASKLAALSIKYHWLSVLMLAILLMLGFRISTPKDAISDVTKTMTEDRIRDSLSIVGLRIVDEANDRERMYIKDLLEASVVFQCLDARKTRKEDLIQTARLPCARLLREKGITE